MKQLFLSKKLPLLVLGSALVITVAFAQSNAGSAKTDRTDTVPRKQKQVRDLDEALLDLDKGELEMQKAFREIDGEKLERELRAAMKGLDVDLSKMREELAKSLKEIDAQKINADVQKAMVEVQKAMKEVDGEKIKGEVQTAMAEAQKALKEVDVEKLRAEVQASLSKVDMEKVNVELRKLREEELPKLREELKTIRPEIEKSLREAKVGIEKARQEITAYKSLVDALDRDGHLKKSGDYNIEYNDGELTVNGKKLSAADTKKYTEFLQGKKNFTLKKSEDGLNINNR